MSGQVRASCCSACLSWAHVPLSGTGEKKGGGSKGGPPALVGTRDVSKVTTIYLLYKMLCPGSKFKKNYSLNY